METTLAIASPIAVVILGAFIAGIGWLYRHEKERREEVERQISEKKYGAYTTLIDIFFEQIELSKIGKTIPESEIASRMMQANKSLMIYGSDEVLKTYHKWVNSSRTGNVSLKLFGEVIVSIRRDMGNKKTKIMSEDILRNLITDYDESVAKGLI